MIFENLLLNNAF